jgi:hypothetical protein
MPCRLLLALPNSFHPPPAALTAGKIHVDLEPPFLGRIQVTENKGCAQYVKELGLVAARL